MKKTKLCASFGLQHFVSLMLALSFVVPFITSLTIIHYQKKQIKNQIKQSIIAGISKKDLVYFAFSNAEIFHKLHFEHPKEFEYQGYLYDIVHEEKTTDSTFFWCWCDYQETQLNQKLYNLLKLALEHTPTPDFQFKVLFFSPTIFLKAFVPMKIYKLFHKIHFYDFLPIQHFSIPPENEI